jgi:ERCC4-type nuclease
MPIENLLKKLSAPAQRAIQSTGVKTVEALAEISEKEIMDLHGIGKNAMETIKAFIAENGLSFKKT